MWRFFTRIFSIVCVFAIQPDAGFSQTRPKVVVGYASMSTVATTLWVAQERGFFAKNGLDVQAIFIPGSPTLIASLNTGDVHFGYTGGTATLGGAVGGLDIKMIAAFANHVQTDLVVRPEIKTPADLRGKRIGVTSIVVRSDYLAKQQSIARNTLKAMIESHAFVHNHANKAAVIEITSKKLGITDPVAANDGYEDYLRRTDRKASISIEGVKNIQRFMKLRNPKIADVNLERLIDESLLRELEKSSLVEQSPRGETVR